MEKAKHSVDKSATEHRDGQAGLEELPTVLRVAAIVIPPPDPELSTRVTCQRRS